MKCPECGHNPEGKSNQQLRALHKYARELSDALIAGGVDTLLPIPVKIPTSPSAVKTNIIHPIITSLYGKSSLAQLTKKEMSETITILLDIIPLHYAVEVEFPSMESLQFKSLQYEDLH